MPANRQARQQRLCGHLLPQAQQEAAARQPAVQEGVLAGGAALGEAADLHQGDKDNREEGAAGNG